MSRRAAMRVIDVLVERQEQLGLTNKHLERMHGIGHGHLSRWRIGAQQPRLKSLVDWAEALDLEIVVRERASPSSTASA